MSNSHARQPSAFSRREVPEVCLNVCPKERAQATLKRGRLRPSREGAGNAGRPLHPQSVCKGRKHTGSHHRFTGTPGISLRNGFNGFLRALPGDRACLPPSPPRSLLLENLTPASGRQDHTASPSASGVSSGAFALDAVAATASHPNVRDDRDTPPRGGQDGATMKVIWV